MRPDKRNTEKGNKKERVLFQKEWVEKINDD